MGSVTVVAAKSTPGLFLDLNPWLRSKHSPPHCRGLLPNKGTNVSLPGLPSPARYSAIHFGMAAVVVGGGEA